MFTAKPGRRVAALALALGVSGGAAVTAGVGPAEAAQSSQGTQSRDAVTLTIVPNASGEPGYQLRDRCGGANGTVSFNGAGISTWGEVWSIDTGSCQGGGTHWVYLTWDANTLPGSFDWYSAKAGPGLTAGFNMPTYNSGGTINYIEVYLCSSAYENGGCNDEKILYNSL